MATRRICAVHQKQAYPTYRAAISAALSYSKKRGTPLRYYRDKACGCIHLTSKQKWDRRVGASA